jgi:hypothetical protein
MGQTLDSSVHGGCSSDAIAYVPGETPRLLHHVSIGFDQMRGRSIKVRSVTKPGFSDFLCAHNQILFEKFNQQFAFSYLVIWQIQSKERPRLTFFKCRQHL